MNALNVDEQRAKDRLIHLCRQCYSPDVLENYSQGRMNQNYQHDMHELQREYAQNPTYENLYMDMLLDPGLDEPHLLLFLISNLMSIYGDQMEAENLLMSLAKLNSTLEILFYEKAADGFLKIARFEPILKLVWKHVIRFWKVCITWVPSSQKGGRTHALNSSSSTSSSSSGAISSGQETSKISLESIHAFFEGGLKKYPLASMMDQVHASALSNHYLMCLLEEWIIMMCETTADVADRAVEYNHLCRWSAMADITSQKAVFLATFKEKFMNKTGDLYKFIRRDSSFLMDYIPKSNAATWLPQFPSLGSLLSRLLTLESAIYWDDTSLLSVLIRDKQEEAQQTKLPLKHNLKKYTYSQSYHTWPLVQKELERLIEIIKAMMTDSNPGLKDPLHIQSVFQYLKGWTSLTQTTYGRGDQRSDIRLKNETSQPSKMAQPVSKTLKNDEKSYVNMMVEFYAYVMANISKQVANAPLLSLRQVFFSCTQSLMNHGVFAETPIGQLGNLLRDFHEYTTIVIAHPDIGMDEWTEILTWWWYACYAMRETAIDIGSDGDAENGDDMTKLQGPYTEIKDLWVLCGTFLFSLVERFMGFKQQWFHSFYADGQAEPHDVVFYFESDACRDEMLVLKQLAFMPHFFGELKDKNGLSLGIKIFNKKDDALPWPDLVTNVIELLTQLIDDRSALLLDNLNHEQYQAHIVKLVGQSMHIRYLLHILEQLLEDLASYSDSAFYVNRVMTPGPVKSWRKKLRELQAARVNMVKAGTTLWMPALANIKEDVPLLDLWGQSTIACVNLMTKHVFLDRMLTEGTQEEWAVMGTSEQWARVLIQMFVYYDTILNTKKIEDTFAALTSLSAWYKSESESRLCHLPGLEHHLESAKENNVYQKATKLSEDTAEHFKSMGHAIPCHPILKHDQALSKPDWRSTYAQGLSTTLLVSALFTHKQVLNQFIGHYRAVACSMSEQKMASSPSSDSALKSLLNARKECDAIYFNLLADTKKTFDLHATNMSRDFGALFRHLYSIMTPLLPPDRLFYPAYNTNHFIAQGWSEASPWSISLCQLFQTLLRQLGQRLLENVQPQDVSMFLRCLKSYTSSCHSTLPLLVGEGHELETKDPELTFLAEHVPVWAFKVLVTPFDEKEETDLSWTPADEKEEDVPCSILGYFMHIQGSPWLSSGLSPTFYHDLLFLVEQDALFQEWEDNAPALYSYVKLLLGGFSTPVGRRTLIHHLEKDYYTQSNTNGSLNKSPRNGRARYACRILHWVFRLLTMTDTHQNMLAAYEASNMRSMCYHLLLCLNEIGLRIQMENGPHASKTRFFDQLWFQEQSLHSTWLKLFHTLMNDFFKGEEYIDAQHNSCIHVILKVGPRVPQLVPVYFRMFKDTFKVKADFASQMDLFEKELCDTSDADSFDTKKKILLKFKTHVNENYVPKSTESIVVMSSTRASHLIGSMYEDFNKDNKCANVAPHSSMFE